MCKSLFFLALLGLSSSLSVLTSSKPAEALTCTFGMVDGGSAPYRSNSWEQILDFDDDE